MTVEDVEESIPTVAVDGITMTVLLFGDGGELRSAAAAARTRMRAVGLVDDMECFCGSRREKGGR
jgi:hypothetical protein